MFYPHLWHSTCVQVDHTLSLQLTVSSHSQKFHSYWCDASTIPQFYFTYITKNRINSILHWQFHSTKQYFLQSWWSLSRSRNFLRLWNWECHYCIHQNPPLVSILNPLNPVHTLSAYCFKTYIIIIITPPLPLFPHVSLHQHTELPRSIFTWGFLIRFAYMFLILPCKLHALAVTW